MFKHTLLGILVIMGATSCVPQTAERTPPPPKPKVVSDPRALLRGLALDVPDDIVVRADPQGAAPIPAAAPAFLATMRSEEDRARASDCLTAAIYYEARSEPIDGQRAVAQVVLNRVRDRAFPSTICGVVYQGSERRTGCQFSFTCDGSMLRQRDWRSWAESRAVADAALAGAVYAPAGSATHYHASSILPWWAPSLSRIGLIGSQVFYRWRDGMERALAFRQQYAGYEPDVAAGTGLTPSTVAGVEVHYGNEDSGYVTVHRGSAPEAAAVVPTAPLLVTVAGVRIHRNTDMPDAEYSGEPAEIASAM